MDILSYERLPENSKNPINSFNSIHSFIAFKLIYNSNESHHKLPIHSNEVSIHQKHLCTLAAEKCKRLADMNPDFMKPYFIVKELDYNLWNDVS